MKRRGFTLIELLIVIIVIGILATFAVPQYFKAVERAKVGKAKNALMLAVKANKLYMAEHDAYSALMTDLNEYIEMPNISGSGVVDTDWTYTCADTGAATATRTGGGTAYNTETIIMNADGSIDATSSHDFAD